MSPINQVAVAVTMSLGAAVGAYMGSYFGTRRAHLTMPPPSTPDNADPLDLGPDAVRIAWLHGRLSRYFDDCESESVPDSARV